MSKPLSFSAIIPSPIGLLGLSMQNQKLVHLAFLPPTANPLPAQDEVTQSIVAVLDQYFVTPNTPFQLPYDIVQPSTFRTRFNDALLSIPAGETLTYGQLAARLQSSPRAIGQACRSNPLPIIIPCHRIVAKTHLGGFSGAVSGDLINIKSWLLQHERH